jgi:hypothetical protein
MFTFICGGMVAPIGGRSSRSGRRKKRILGLWFTERGSLNQENLFILLRLFDKNILPLNIPPSWLLSFVIFTGPSIRIRLLFSSLA